ncbi:cytochrome b-c1 complex subunit 1, mitochondrial-like [Bicyclus anynana]|uniref:Cytochrome b-c1 complex subunit 1, mitochondrial-like n=1 Tax=Bicyclus anynana TaxID=110368 RepID=A0A6J1NF76_BICAN|nr:cytochrome b-c1 complex subunit 1, mitochondrial-like [Bicyclus anynana]
MLSKVWIPVKKCFQRNVCTVTSSHFLKNFPPTQYSMLSNGLTIATEERSSSNVCIGVYIGSGSRVEDESHNGFTHFFEHIAFKGSMKRSRENLETEISKTGARFKYFTTREFTVYYAECLVRDFKCVADILCESVFNNAFIGAEIEQQKHVVYQEMLQHDVSTKNTLYDYLHSTAFQGTPLAQTVMGPSKNLYSLQNNYLCEFITKMFTAQRTVLVAVGGIPHEAVVSLGQEHLCNVDPCCSDVINLGPKRYTGSEIIYRNDSMPVAHVAIAVEGPSFTDENKIVMDLVTSYFGGWDESQPRGINHGTRLAHQASVGGLCESYKAFNIHYKDTGLCGVEFISPKLETDDMILTIQEEWMRLCHMVTDNELLRAKNELKSKILTKVQTTTGAFHDIGLNVFQAGYRPSIYEQMVAIDNISAARVKNVCEEYFYDKCPVISGIGATEGIMQYSRTRSWMYWLKV